MKRSRNLSIFRKKIPVLGISSTRVTKKRDIKERATASIAQDLNRDVADGQVEFHSRTI